MWMSFFCCSCLSRECEWEGSGSDGCRDLGRLKGLYSSVATYSSRSFHYKTVSWFDDPIVGRNWNVKILLLLLRPLPTPRCFRFHLENCFQDDKRLFSNGWNLLLLLLLMTLAFALQILLFVGCSDVTSHNKIPTSCLWLLAREKLVLTNLNPQI